MRLNRGQKTARNLALCLLLGLAVYVMLGFPPYTVRGMLDRAERRYLLSDLEPLLVERSYRNYSEEFFGWHDTYLLARSGDTFLYTNYSRHFFQVRPELRRGAKIGRGTFCTAREGTLYVAGNFENVESAVAEVTVEKTTRIMDPETEIFQTTFGERRTFTYQGEKVNGALFSFWYRGEYGGWYYNVPESGYGLEEAAKSWYRGYSTEDTSGGFSWLHVDVPVKVTLYDRSGQVLDTLELSVDTYELSSRW